MDHTSSRLQKRAAARDTRAVKRALVAVAIAALALQLGGGCEGQGCAAEAAARDAPVGTVIGYVRLELGASLPMYPETAMAHQPLRPRAAPGALPAECAAAAFESRMPVTMNERRGLAGMLVTASEFRRYRPKKPVAHHVRIERCALRPQAVAMTHGDRLVLENLDAFPFAPLYGPAYEAKPLPRGERLFVPTTAATIEPLSCSADAPCGRSDVFVLRHPVHVLTDGHGAFHLESFPAGEQVRLTALHPLFEESETTVWVEPGQQLRVELTVRPKARFVPQPR